MEAVKKATLIVLLIIVGIIFFVLNLWKGTFGADIDIFSVKNIIITGLFFIVGVPVVIAIQKITGKKDESESGRRK